MTEQIKYRPEITKRIGDRDERWRMPASPDAMAKACWEMYLREDIGAADLEFLVNQINDNGEFPGVVLLKYVEDEPRGVGWLTDDRWESF